MSSNAKLWAILCPVRALRVPLKIHFYEIVNNTSQYDVSVQALLEYGDISSPEEFVIQRWTIPPALATFVLTHLSVQLGYAHASMPAALVLADNRSCSQSFSKFFWEGSESLSAKAQVSLFLARFLTISLHQSNF
jgi:hypothetical protein